MFQEIKIKKKSLREVLPPRHAPVARETIPPITRPPVDLPTEREGTSSGGRGWIWTLVLVLVLISAGVYAVTKVFALTTVVVTPYTFELSLDDSLALTRDSAEMGYQLMTLEPAVGTRTVTATGTERVSRPATGTVVIYNNFDKNPLRLIASTRFQSKSGKIYRIRSAVTVPGVRTVAGKTEPGVAEAVIYAEEPGAEYNSEPTDFTLPGLKGDARFDKVFARSKGPVSGGVVGEVKKLSPDEETKARESLRKELTQKLLDSAKAKVPQSYVLFNDLAFVEIKDLSDLSAGTGDQVVIKEQLTLQAVILPELAITTQLVGTKIPNYTAAELRISNLDELKVGLATMPPSLTDAKNLAVKISGTAKLLPKIDLDMLGKTISGLDKTSAAKKIGEEKGVQKYTVTYRPPWLSGVPESPDRVQVELAP